MKRKLTLSSLLLFVLFLGMASTASATTIWYVDGVHGSDQNNCKSPVTACKTIGHAISLATSGDSIMVAAATYRENLIIGVSLTITGLGASTTIVDGGGINTVVVVSNANAHARLSKVTIQHGTARCGGGVYNGGTLTISNTAISGNSAGNACGGGGIYNYGTLTISNSTISGNSIGGNSAGGGIYNYGTLTISNSTISGNNANDRIYAISRGGGIYNGGTMQINKSTISGNSMLWGEGGGIENDSALTITNSTLSGNHGGRGGIVNVNGALAINNSTISENSPHVSSEIGGIESLYTTVTLQNSIVANNSGGNCDGVTSDGYNLSSDNTCNFSNIGDRNNTDPKLGPLQNNGGPTQTMALLPGSPAIDAGNPSGCTDGQGHLLTTDQRGMPRHDKEDSSGCDTGAYERQTD